MSMAVLPKAKGDEEKISIALNKLLEEDPTFKLSRDIENAETYYIRSWRNSFRSYSIAK